MKCHCGEIAEVRWTYVGGVHEFCSNCMSNYWSEIKLKYQGSKALEESLFESITH